jgi:hypothetical protein
MDQEDKDVMICSFWESALRRRPLTVLVPAPLFSTVRLWQKRPFDLTLIFLHPLGLQTI